MGESEITRKQKNSRKFKSKCSCWNFDLAISCNLRAIGTWHNQIQELLKVLRVYQANSSQVTTRKLWEWKIQTLTQTCWFSVILKCLVMFKVLKTSYLKIILIKPHQFTGVGFTKYCRDNCLNAGIKGWVKNSKRGTIVGKMQGLKPEIDKM